nr:DUF4829 domain-containing protein [uncultured Peptostreptococcus sp.]
MKKKIFIILLICICAMCIFAKLKENSEENETYTNKAFSLAESTVRDYILAMDKRDFNKLDKLLINSDEVISTIKSSRKNSIENIVSIDYVRAEPSNLKYKPQVYHINGKEKEFKKGILLDVTYDVKYKNDNQPESNGLNSMIYELVWDDGRYLISGIGTGP